VPVTGGVHRSSLTVNGQRLTVDLGLDWAGLLAGLGQSGPGRAGHVAAPRGATSRCGLEMGSNLVGVAHGGHDRAVHGCSHGSRWTASIPSSLLTVHGAPGARNHAAAAPSPPLVHERTPERDAAGKASASSLLRGSLSSPSCARRVSCHGERDSSPPLTSTGLT
jgi:hypothetical protein